MLQYEEGRGRIIRPFLVVGKVKVKFGWRREGRRGNGEVIVKVGKLEEMECRRSFVEGLRREWERVRYGEVEAGDVEEEWRCFKGAVMRVAKEVCGCKVRRKGNNSRVRE